MNQEVKELISVIKYSDINKKSKEKIINIIESRNKTIDDVFEILNKYNVHFNAKVNYEILQLKEGGKSE